MHIYAYRQNIFFILFTTEDSNKQNTEQRKGAGEIRGMERNMWLNIKINK